MIKLKIDNNEIEVAEGTTILEAAKALGVEIPTMCHLEGGEHFTSCMICMVKDVRNGRLMPSCSMPVMEGMDIITNDDECNESRKAALELLLSEHVGDCEGPCQGLCPAHMDIPLMNRLVASGNYDKAIEVIRRDIAIPAILGRICPAPCEAGCRRKGIDGSVAICQIKGFTADEHLKKCVSRDIAPDRVVSGKKVAIIGAGPAGMAAAYYLDIAGHSVTIYDKNEKAGGALLQISNDILPEEVREKEIKYVLSGCISANYNINIDGAMFDRLRQENDAVIIATGGTQAGEWGVKLAKSGVEVQAGTFLTSLENVFAIGNTLRVTKVAVRSAAHGKELAAVLDYYFATGKLKPVNQRFSSKFGKLVESEFGEYLKDSIDETRTEASRGKAAGFIVEEAIVEAKRCLHCDCRKPDNCKLRDLCEAYGAQQKRFSYGDRRMVSRQFGFQGVVYEENKCIKCGKCVQLTREEKETFGFTFIGRGFDVKVGVPFNESLKKALSKTAKMVIKNCPTGAISEI